MTRLGTHSARPTQRNISAYKRSVPGVKNSKKSRYGSSPLRTLTPFVAYSNWSPQTSSVVCGSTNSRSQQNANVEAASDIISHPDRIGVETAATRGLASATEFISFVIRISADFTDGARWTIESGFSLPNRLRSAHERPARLTQEPFADHMLNLRAAS